MCYNWEYACEEILANICVSMFNSHVQINCSNWNYLLLALCDSMLMSPKDINRKTLKYWDGVQRGHSYLMGKRCLFSLEWWCHDKNVFWSRCFTLTSFAPDFFFLGLLKRNLDLFLVQLRLAWGDEWRRWMLVVAVISIDTYPFLTFP